MAESSLSVTFDDLEIEVGSYLGWPLDSDDWTADQDIHFGQLLKRGLRWFYYPMKPESDERYSWSFMLQTGSLSLTNADADYDLPDDFAGIVDGDVLFSATNRRVSKCPMDRLLNLRAVEGGTGVPKYFAVRAKAVAPTTGNRYEMIFHPTPNASLTAVFRYPIAANVIDGTNKYPLGGALHSETIIAAVLAAAEERMDDSAKGERFEKFQQLLAASIRADMAVKEAM